MEAALAQAVFALGGGLGAVARHALGRRVIHRFPLATLLVNVLGSAALGAALALTGGASYPAEARQLVGGFCGGFTTFSSFAVQTLALGRGGGPAHAAANVALNLGSCVAAFVAGRFAAGG